MSANPSSSVGTPANPAKPAASTNLAIRFAGLDACRGLIMVGMALDHCVYLLWTGAREPSFLFWYGPFVSDETLPELVIRLIANPLRTLKPDENWMNYVGVLSALGVSMALTGILNRLAWAPPLGRGAYGASRGSHSHFSRPERTITAPCRATGVAWKEQWTGRLFRTMDGSALWPW